MRRRGRVKREIGFTAFPIIVRSRQALPPPRGGVGHKKLPRVAVEQETIAVVRDLSVAFGVVGQEVEVAVVDAGSGGAGEELRAVVVVVVGEDALHRVREEVREQQPPGVHDGAPRPAHAPGRGEVMRLEAAEDDRLQRVVGQRLSSDLADVNRVDKYGGLY